MLACMANLQVAAKKIFDLFEVYDGVRCDNPVQGYSTVEWNASSLRGAHFGEPLRTSDDKCPDMADPESFKKESKDWYDFKPTSKIV